jgi:hypothetical protein
MFITPIGWLLARSGIALAPPAQPLPLAAVAASLIFVAAVLLVLVAACRTPHTDAATHERRRHAGGLHAVWLRHAGVPGCVQPR